MLNKLFGSNARVKILKLFLSNPEKKFYIRQIARDIELQLNSVRRELENLERFGLLCTVNPSEEEVRAAENYYEHIATKGDLLASEEKKSLVKKNIKPKKTDLKKSEKKYFQANKDFILFEEIKSLITKARILYERDFIDKLNDVGSLKLVILTGYFVGVEGRPVDLLIAGRLNKPKVLGIIKELETELGRELNYTLMDSKELEYRQDITDVFLYDIFEGKKIIIVNETGLS
jgi:DNA-binding transcriptional regulator YhcF (GntR family)